MKPLYRNATPDDEGKAWVETRQVVMVGPCKHGNYAPHQDWNGRWNELQTVECDGKPDEKVTPYLVDVTRESDIWCDGLPEGDNDKK